LVAIYLGRQLGGHRHEEIGKTVGLGKTSSVSSAYLLMKERVAKENGFGLQGSSPLLAIDTRFTMK